jgi:hypothetical protein
VKWRTCAPGYGFGSNRPHPSLRAYEHPIEGIPSYPPSVVTTPYPHIPGPMLDTIAIQDGDACVQDAGHPSSPIRSQARGYGHRRTRDRSGADHPLSTGQASSTLNASIAISNRVEDAARSRWGCRRRLMTALNARCADDSLHSSVGCVY